MYIDDIRFVGKQEQMEDILAISGPVSCLHQITKALA
jgi:hypothetical protein